jgi:hypothetical protein
MDFDQNFLQNPNGVSSVRSKNMSKITTLTYIYELIGYSTVQKEIIHGEEKRFPLNNEPNNKIIKL